jgi:hypothetical protein
MTFPMTSAGNPKGLPFKPPLKPTPRVTLSNRLKISYRDDQIAQWFPVVNPGG